MIILLQCCTSLCYL